MTCSVLVEIGGCCCCWGCTAVRKQRSAFLQVLVRERWQGARAQVASFGRRSSRFFFFLVVDRHVTCSLSLRKPDKSQIRAPRGGWWIPSAVKKNQRRVRLESARWYPTGSARCVLPGQNSGVSWCCDKSILWRVENICIIRSDSWVDVMSDHLCKPTPFPCPRDEISA